MSKRICAMCGDDLPFGQGSYVSGVYGSRGALLHLDCGLTEEAEIEKAGTNNLPALVARYQDNLKMFGRVHHNKTAWYVEVAEGVNLHLGWVGKHPNLFVGRDENKAAWVLPHASGVSADFLRFRD